MSGSATELHVCAEGVRKSFGATQALRGAWLRVPRGGIEGLVGHNGAGKSTLIAIVSGALNADSGTVTIDGTEVSGVGVAGIERHGLELVTQATSVFAQLSVLDNLLIPRWFPVRARTTIRWREARRRARAALSRVGLPGGLDRPVSSMSVPARRRLMIARALLREPRLLILDEPTEAFTESEVTQLFELLRHLASSAMTMVYVSHRLDEVLEITDHVTVMREGATVGRFPAPELDRSALLAAILGGDVPALQSGRLRGVSVGAERPAVLVLDEVSSTKLVSVSLTVHAGEVVGLYGLAGAGRSQLLRLIAGADTVAGGRLDLHGQPLATSIAGRRRQGISYQPQDTAAEAALSRLTVRENVTIAVAGGVRARAAVPVVSRRREVGLTRAALRRVGLERVATEAPLESLSGGMQQRVMIARSVVSGASLWLLDEPMTGLDVRSRLELAEVLRELVGGEEPRGALVVLSDYDDLCLMCDRVYTLRAGRVTGTFAAGMFTEHDLLHAVSFEQAAAA
jgi:ABC-type sugar transport system ATPase subunit